MVLVVSVEVEVEVVPARGKRRRRVEVDPPSLGSVFAVVLRRGGRRPRAPCPVIATHRRDHV